MNERDLKNGLRQLSNEGWFVAEVTEDFLESLLGRPEDPPSDGNLERCLSRLQVRVQAAMRRQALPVGNAGKIALPKTNRPKEQHVHSSHSTAFNHTEGQEH
jgi:hypothetical protein